MHASHLQAGKNRSSLRCQEITIIKFPPTQRLCIPKERRGFQEIENLACYILLSKTSSIYHNHNNRKAKQMVSFVGDFLSPLVIHCCYILYMFLFYPFCKAFPLYLISLCIFGTISRPSFVLKIHIIEWFVSEVYPIPHPPP